MSLDNCDPYVTCDENNGLSNEQIFRELITKNENGCPSLRVKAEGIDVSVGDLALELNPDDAGVAIYGSDDGGATKRIIKTDAGGAIQVDLEVASVTVTSVTSSASTAKVDIGLVNGEAVDVGPGTEAAAIRVTLPTDGTGKIGTVGAVTAITNALPAGNNNIGDVDIASGTITTITNPVGVKGADGTGIASNANPVPISDAGSSISVDWNGTQPVTGSGTATAALRVELPTDGTGKVGLNAGSAVVGKVGIDQTTPGTTNLVQNKSMPDATATFCPTEDLSGALEASSVSKASAGVFYGLSGYNSSSSAQFILIYNSTTVPGDGAVTPKLVLRVQPTASFSLDTGTFGVYFSTGIAWSNSTNASPFTKALGSADCFVNLQYQ